MCYFEVMQMKTTIREIAKEAKCSVTTVSLVMNGKTDSISEATQKRVFEAVQRLKYRPNIIAAELAAGKSKTIALIIPDNRNPLFGGILKYATSTAEDSGYRVITFNSDDCIYRDLTHIEASLDYRVAGIAIVRSNAADMHEEQKLADKVRNLSTPTVAIDRSIAGADVPLFGVNNRHGGYIATRHLLEMGHRRIGCYTGPLNVSSAQQRLEGYKMALLEYGIPYDPDMVFEGDYKMLKGSTAYDFFMARRVTAVFSHNDIQAFGLYRHLQLAGKRVPGDWSIVGYDDLDFSAIITPSLTTVHFPVEELTRDAIQGLIGLIEGKKTQLERGSVIQFEPHLICRDSVKRLD